MKKNWGLTFAILAVACVLFMTAQAAYAGKGRGKGKGKKTSVESSSHGGSSSDLSTPPGWSKGKKTGWGDGKYPPGWSKWDEKKKGKWKGDRTEALTEIDGVCVRHRLRAQKRNEISQAFDEAIAGGLIINESRKKLVRALNDPNERKALMIDTTKSVLDLLK